MPNYEISKEELKDIVNNEVSDLSVIVPDGFRMSQMERVEDGSLHYLRITKSENNIFVTEEIRIVRRIKK